ncbi:MAG TPA: hypothetical protein VHC72_02830 [Bryobacteraceae bacterium]|nr:hypothetical protein [Bryobacteraceae bacterium]
MSDEPTVASGSAPVPATDAPGSPGIPPGPGWFRRLSSVLFIIFCFELGLFLLIYPWTSGWSDNYFAWAVPGSVLTTWHSFWNNSYVRGCISGIGIVNLWIAIAEVFRMFARNSRPGN